MLPEHAVVFYPNNIVSVIWVIIFEMEQNLELNSCLMLELLLISNNLNSNYLSRLMINALERLSKRPFTQKVNDLEPIRNMVLQHDIIVSSLIIIAEIILLSFRPFDLLGPNT